MSFSLSSRCGHLDKLSCASLSSAYLRISALQPNVVASECWKLNNENLQYQGPWNKKLFPRQVANFTVTEEEAGPGWDTIIPKDQIEAIQQAEQAANEVPLYIPPRRKKNVNYTGTVVSRRNHSDSDGEKHHPRSKRRKLDPPSHKKRRFILESTHHLQKHINQQIW